MANPSLYRLASLPLYPGLVVLVLTAGCQAIHAPVARDYRTVQADPNRDTDRAKVLHEKAIRILEHCDTCYRCECVAKTLCRPCEAEKHLQDALIADVRFGPAHNTLGTLYLRQHRLYLAAWEFEYASNLMPARAEPHNNLGLVYEEAGRLGRAIEQYEIAAEMDPRNSEYLGNLVKASLKQGTPLEEVRYLLLELLMVEARPGWIRWAEDLLGTNPAERPVVRDLGPVDGSSEPARVEADSAVVEGVEVLPAPDGERGDEYDVGPLLMEKLTE